MDQRCFKFGVKSIQRQGIVEPRAIYGTGQRWLHPFVCTDRLTTMAEITNEFNSSDAQSMLQHIVYRYRH